MNRRRDIAGLIATILSVLFYTIVTALPAKGNTLQPPPAQEQVAKDKVLPLQPGDVIIRDPHALRPQHPYSPLPRNWKERRKDPQSWAYSRAS